MQKHNIGGSLLPSGSREVYAPKSGKHGTFETRPMPDLDTHGLFYSSAERAPMLIAAHPNGFTCDELAKRILAAWEGGSVERALEQFDYALACGGIGKSRAAIEHIARAS